MPLNTSRFRYVDIELSVSRRREFVEQYFLSFEGLSNTQIGQSRISGGQRAAAVPGADALEFGVLDLRRQSSHM